MEQKMPWHRNVKIHIEGTVLHIEVELNPDKVEVSEGNMGTYYASVITDVARRDAPSLRVNVMVKELEG